MTHKKHTVEYLVWRRLVAAFLNGGAKLSTPLGQELINLIRVYDLINLIIVRVYVRRRTKKSKLNDDYSMRLYRQQVKPSSPGVPTLYHITR